MRRLQIDKKSDGIIWISWGDSDVADYNYNESTYYDYIFFCHWLNERAHKDILIKDGKYRTGFKYYPDILGLIKKKPGIKILRRVFMISQAKLDKKNKIKKDTEYCHKMLQKLYFLINNLENDPNRWMTDLIKAWEGSGDDVDSWVLNRFGYDLVNKAKDPGIELEYFKTNTTSTQKLRYLYRSPLVNKKTLLYVSGTKDWYVLYLFKLFDPWSAKSMNFNVNRLQEELKFIKSATEKLKAAIKNNFMPGNYYEYPLVIEKLDVIYKTLNISKKPFPRDIDCSRCCSYGSSGVLIKK